MRGYDYEAKPMSNQGIIVNNNEALISKINRETPKRNRFILAIFFLSGFPALIYQIVWQRALFTIYGVNIESVTVVVAAFMLGLGLGSLLGGYLSKNPRVPVIAAFSVTELIIGLYGFNSLSLFKWVGSFTLGSPPLNTGLITFLLVLVPTLMMGATLPLMVAYLVKQTSNVGRSTGMLYFFNTLGSAFASLCAAVFLLGAFGGQGSVNIAAVLNMIVATSAFALYLRQKGNPVAIAMVETVRSAGWDTALPFHFAMVLVFLSGFIALSYEIIWFRVFNFALASSAATFPLVLSMYLAGIAWGASEVRRFCPDGENGKSSVRARALAAFILLANLCGFLLVPMAGQVFQSLHPGLALLLIIPAAACLGVTLPLVSHMAIPPDNNAGAKLSFLYLANIIGSTLGSLLTGYVLMDYWSISNIALFLALLGFAMGLMLLFPARLKKATIIAACCVTGTVAFLATTRAGSLYDRIYEQLLFKHDYSPGKRFAHVVENKSGIIAVEEDGIVYGEGVYDGRFNIDPIRDPNLIVRAFSLSAFHESPGEVLMIGLSSGSWAQVIANNPFVEKLTIVEINPGYQKIIPRYPMVSSLLENPKVEIVVDDGRRWLARSRSRKFDAIVMNTTWHWRSFTSNLLSVEFLSLAKAHLKEGGILYYNTTDSTDAQKTGAMVFPSAYRFCNFLAVSDSPIIIDKQRLRKVLQCYYIDGKPVFDLSKREHIDKLGEILARFDTASDRKSNWGGLENRESILMRTRGARLITDENMATEWKRLF